MINIPLQAIPNQSLSITLDNNQYDIRIHAIDDVGSVAVDIAIDNVVIVTGIFALPDFPIIPARYLENGNFVITTENDDIPNWNQFAVDQYLIYVSQTELNTIRGT